MRTFKKMMAAITASALTLSMAAGMTGLTSATAADKTAIELVNDMGMGWNLGNTFDCWNTRGWTTDTETAWGNAKTTQAMINAIKASGFDSVRIPITWYENTDSTTYDIDDAYLERISEVVDYCYANDMYVIINMHWDWVSDGSLWLNKGEAALPQFTTMWTEIANYFKDYDEHLVFEGMNEVTFAYDVLNKFNQTFVDTIRATGGSNADRLLLLPGKNTDPYDTCNDAFVVPDDDMVAVSIHYYQPPTWAVADSSSTWGYKDTWGTDADIAAVYNDFSRMKTYFVDKGVPVIIGEYGVLTNDKKDKDDIAEYLETVASAGLQTDGIATFLWDAGNAGDMQFFNRKSLSWYDSNIEKVYAKLSNGEGSGPGLTQTNKVSFTPAQMEAIDSKNDYTDFNYQIDISQYKGVANIISVIIEGTVTGTGDSYGVGGGVAFQATRDGVAGAYTSEAWGMSNSDGTAVVELDGITTDDDGNELSYVMDYEYMQFNTWWNWGADDAYFKLDKVTLVFDADVYVKDDNPGEEETTEPKQEETTEPKQEETTEPKQEETTEPPVAELPEYYMCLIGQYAGEGFWDADEYFTEVKKGTHSYSITVDKQGETKAGDLCLILDSNINIYEFALNEDSDGLTDGTIKISIDSILVDGVEVPYTTSEGAIRTSDDGKMLRVNIYNTWGGGVTDIDPNLTITEGITVNFTLTLGEADASEVSMYGDVDEDGTVNLLDVVLLNQHLMVGKSITDQGKLNADVDQNGTLSAVDSLNILKASIDLITLPV